MKKIFFLISFCISLNTNSIAQRLEFIGAVNYNVFHGGNIIAHDQKQSSYLPIYKNGYGYAFSVGVDDVKIGNTPFRFTLKYDHYTGSTSYSSSGRGSSREYDLSVKKNTLGLGIYPVNATFFHHLKLSLGAEFNFLVYAQQNGTQSSWFLTNDPNHPSVNSNSVINNDSHNINRIFNFGVNTSLRYEFLLAQNFWIAPQAMLYVSMSNEFTSSFEDTRSIRPYLGIALIKNLRKTD